MDFPPDYVLGESLKVGTVYKISAPEIISSDVPHYFIVIAIIDENNYALVCTTQLHNKIKYVQDRKIPEDTICMMEPNEANGLTKRCYLNCNDYVELTNEFLKRKISEGSLRISGSISVEEYEKIVNSIKQSPLFDIPLDFLVY